jgi:hypothetical protein
MAAADDRRRLFRYSLYATGVPVIVAAVTLTVELLPPDYDVLRPGFGIRNCFFDTPLASFVYFHMLLLVIQVNCDRG